MARRWSDAAEARLRGLYATMPMPQLCFQLKRTAKSINSRAKLLGLRKSTRRPWAKRELQLLRKRYPHEPTARLAKDLGRSASTVHQKAVKIGLHKSRAYMQGEYARNQRRIAMTNPGMIASRIKPGNVPANKGLRRPGWSVGRMAETQFKKGRPAVAAHNYVPIGTEKYDVKRKTIVRKLTDDPAVFPVNRWRPVHVLVWEAEHGPVPKGHIVRFKKGLKTLVTTEITIDRLELVTLAENMRLNSFHNNYPKEVGLAIQAKAVLTRAINRAKRETEEASHD